MGKIVQTAGRNTLGEFAPEFAHFNDDVLFGENWNNQDIDVKTRSIITVVALMASGITDSSLRYHLQNAKNHGVTQKEIAAVITHAAFYAGWSDQEISFSSKNMRNVSIIIKDIKCELAVDGNSEDDNLQYIYIDMGIAGLGRWLFLQTY